MTRCSSRGLLSLLDERGPAAATSLAAALDAHPMTVRTKCHDLQSAGHVHQISGDVYTITEAGRDHLSTLTE
ncbi:hypothetical protein [Natronorubrum sulfidifaciens]|uniref:Uncharacterized protein n=1 Tax=Natronorubrum sulfidifaciens JCM 14089 TaxID=1230460 RepID=L9W1J2_9EURY|nr:hypothetical protein [Natronorubrum sulfidifaciens]ELY43359.1 hypothetical protein C495_13276 [Natronorubrum sulfidifaciens JCM 14089]